MIRIARPKARTLAMVALPVVAVAITVPTVAIAVGESATPCSGAASTTAEIYRVTTGAVTARPTATDVF